MTNDKEKEELRKIADQEISYNNKLMDKIQHLEAKLKSQELIIQAAKSLILAYRNMMVVAKYKGATEGDKKLCIEKVNQKESEYNEVLKSNLKE